MEFEYMTSIFIASEDLRQMFLRVKNGENFRDVYNDIMEEYEDEDYYNRFEIIDQVKEVIDRRLEQSREAKEERKWKK